MINELPTIFEVVTGTAKKQVKEKSSSNHGSNKSKSNSKAVKLLSMRTFVSRKLHKMGKSWQGKRLHGICT